MGTFLPCPDCHDHRLRRIDHSIEIFDPEHAHIGDAGGAALIFVHLELAGLGAIGKVFHFRGNRAERFCVGALDDRCDQAAGDADRDRDICAFECLELVAFDRDITFRHLHQRDRQRLDQQIIDRQLDATRFQRSVEFAAQFEQFVEFDIHGQVDMRNRLLGFGQATRNGLAHAG